MYLSLYTYLHYHFLDSECCIECTNVQQRSDSHVSNHNLVISPHLRFSCNGRITSVRAGLNRLQNRNDFVTFQLWRPLLSGTIIINKVGEIQLRSDNQVREGYNNFEATIILTSEERLEFQLGDVIGYYHPPQSRYQVLDVYAMGYKLYRFDEISPPNAIHIGEANRILNDRQPLLQFTFGKNSISTSLSAVYSIIILLLLCCRYPMSQSISTSQWRDNIM